MAKSLCLQRLKNLHKNKDCVGFCAIHHPSNHHMKNWKFVVRFDRGGLIERICKHGIGHPDPDSLTYLEGIGSSDKGVHGCDGCCSPKPKKGR